MNGKLRRFLIVLGQCWQPVNFFLKLLTIVLIIGGYITLIVFSGQTVTDYAKLSDADTCDMAPTYYGGLLAGIFMCMTLCIMCFCCYFGISDPDVPAIMTWFTIIGIPLTVCTGLFASNTIFSSCFYNLYKNTHVLTICYTVFIVAVIPSILVTGISAGIICAIVYNIAKCVVSFFTDKKITILQKISVIVSFIMFSGFIVLCAYAGIAVKEYGHLIKYDSCSLPQHTLGGLLILLLTLSSVSLLRLWKSTMIFLWGDNLENGEFTQRSEPVRMNTCASLLMIILFGGYAVAIGMTAKHTIFSECFSQYYNQLIMGTCIAVVLLSSLLCLTYSIFFIIQFLTSVFLKCKKTYDFIMTDEPIDTKNVKDITQTPIDLELNATTDAPQT